ncbi:MAG: hypothetical protein IGS03_17260 [Candidatus Sericytochromatia bacterium]|nr:hypothetical protein [Candidatus Sericytochromatia bacterium]
MSKKKHKKPAPKAKSSAPAAKHPPLQILAQKLEAQNYEASFIPQGEDDEVPFDNLVVILDELDEQPEDSANVLEPELLLQIFFVEDMMKAHEPDLPADETPDFSTLQFILELPTDWDELADERLEEGLLLLNAFSQRMPVGHFTLEEGALIYTYSLLAENQRINSTVILAALDLMRFFIAPMNAIFEAFASDNLSLEAALDQLDERISAA